MRIFKLTAGFAALITFLVLFGCGTKGDPSEFIPDNLIMGSEIATGQGTWVETEDMPVEDTADNSNDTDGSTSNGGIPTVGLCAKLRVLGIIDERCTTDGKSTLPPEERLEEHAFAGESILIDNDEFDIPIQQDISTSNIDIHSTQTPLEQLKILLAPAKPALKRIDR